MLLRHFNLKERGKILISERMKVEKWLFSFKFSYPSVLLSRSVFIVFPLQRTIKNTFCITVKFSLSLSLSQTHTPEIKFKKYHMPCTIILKIYLFNSGSFQDTCFMTTKLLDNLWRGHVSQFIEHCCKR